MVTIQKRLCFFYVVFFYLLLSCNSNKEKEYTRILNLKSNEGSNQLVIENSSNSLAKFSLNIDRQSINNFDDICSIICNMSDEFPNEQIERKAWRFVIERFEYNIPLSFQKWAQTPLVALNSIGCGYSGDHALLLFNIWRQLGFEARIWQLNGHDVPEVKINGKWQMYDSTYEIYFLNNQNEIAGVRELIENPKLITDPILNRIPIVPNDLRRIYNFAYRHSDNLVDIYSSTEDNIKSSWIKSDKIVNEIYFQLPPKATLSMPITNSHPIVIANEHGLEKRFDDCLKIKLSQPWAGEISMPIYLSNINGNAELLLNGRELNIENERIDLYPEENTSFPQHIEIKEMNGPLELFYLFNAGKMTFDTITVIDLIGENIDSLELFTIQGIHDSSSMDDLNVMYERFSRTPEYLVLFEEKKEVLKKKMFSQERPITSLSDIQENLKVVFSMEVDRLEASDNLLETALVKSFNNVLLNLDLEKTGAFYQIISDPRFFVVMIQMAEFKSPEFMEEFISGLLNHN